MNFTSTSLKGITIKSLLLLVLLTFFLIACSGPKTKEENVVKDSTQAVKAQTSPVASEEPDSNREPEEDQYTLILKHVDNRVVIYINDSTIFDSGEVLGGTYEREIDLTEYVINQKNNLKIELYNTNPPDESMRPGWMIVYDIFINDELVEFISEKRNESREGVVFTESYDLSDIW